MKSMRSLWVLLLVLAASAAATTPAAEDDEATEAPNWRENWALALASGDRDTVARAVNPLMQLLTEAKERDKRFRIAVEQLTDAFELPIVLGQETRVNWEQLILNVTNQEREIDVLTPVREAIVWMRRHGRNTRDLPCKAVIKWEKAVMYLKSHLETTESTRAALYYVKALEVQVHDSPTAAARLAANYYKQAKGGVTVVESYDKKSAVLQHALTMMYEFVDNVTEVAASTTPSG